MKVLTYLEGRMTLLFSLELIRPPQGVHAPTYFRELKKRYRFEAFNMDGKAVLSVEPNSPYEFKSGAMETPNGDIPIVGLNIYVDGIGLSCANSENAERVLDDLLRWSQDDYGFLPLPEKVGKHPSSNLVVKFDAEIDNALNKAQGLAEMIGAAHRPHHERHGPWHVLGLKFQPASTPEAAEIRPSFQLERRVGTHNSDAIYFTQAGLRTNEHIALLEKIEQALRN